MPGKRKVGAPTCMSYDADKTDGQYLYLLRPCMPERRRARSLDKSQIGYCSGQARRTAAPGYLENGEMLEEGIRSYWNRARCPAPGTIARTRACAHVRAGFQKILKLCHCPRPTVVQFIGARCISYEEDVRSVWLSLPAGL